MAGQTAADAFEARLAAGFSRCAIFSRNTQGATPLDGSPYVVVQFPLASEDVASIGAPAQRLFREEGAVRFVLHVQRNEGVEQGRQWIDEIRVLFRGVTFSGVVTFAPSPPVEDDDNDNGNYYLLSTAVPYHFDLIA